MGGAYTALPPEDSTPDVPPDWNPEWTFPGPAPPGYEFDYGFDISAPGFVVPGNSTSGTVALTDHTDYATSTPDDGATITLSAKFADTGEEVEITGTALYSYIGLGEGYSGADFEITLGVTALDNGRTVRITTESTPFPGHDVSGTTDVNVVVIDDLNATLTFSWTHGTPTADPDVHPWAMYVSANATHGSWGRWKTAQVIARKTYYTGESLVINETDEIAVGCGGFDGGTATFTMEPTTNVRIAYQLTWGFISGMSLSATLKVYNGDDLLSTNNFSTSEYQGYDKSIWYIYAATGEVIEY